MKCPTNTYLKSNVVYKFTCQCDADLFYIGETKRHIGIRAEEHLNISGITAVGQHINSCEECSDRLSRGILNHESFKVIKSGKSKFDIEVYEALMIKRLGPKLNTQAYLGSSYLLKIFS